VRGGGRSTCLPPRFDNPGYGPVLLNTEYFSVFSSVQFARINVVLSASTSGPRRSN